MAFTIMIFFLLRFDIVKSIAIIGETRLVVFIFLKEDIFYLQFSVDIEIILLIVVGTIWWHLKFCICDILIQCKMNIIGNERHYIEELSLVEQPSQYVSVN